jgi:hypothetical protein
MCRRSVSRSFRAIALNPLSALSRCPPNEFLTSAFILVRGSCSSVDGVLARWGIHHRRNQGGKTDYFLVESARVAADHRSSPLPITEVPQAN